MEKVVFEEPVMEIVEFETTDVIVASEPDEPQPP